LPHFKLSRTVNGGAELRAAGPFACSDSTSSHEAGLARRARLPMPPAPLVKRRELWPVLQHHDVDIILSRRIGGKTAANAAVVEQWQTLEGELRERGLLPLLQKRRALAGSFGSFRQLAEGRRSNIIREFASINRGPAELRSGKQPRRDSLYSLWADLQTASDRYPTVGHPPPTFRFVARLSRRAGDILGNARARTADRRHTPLCCGCHDRHRADPGNT
jgi:hypothetical protein